MYVVAQLKDRVAGLLTGVDIPTVPDINGALERASRTMAQKITVPEGSGRQLYMLYANVYDYLAPTSIFGGALTDFRPQGVSRTPYDEVYRVQVETFDQTKAMLPNGIEVTFEYRAGVPIMRAVTPRTVNSLLLDAMNATTGWAVGGSASGLAVDSTVYYKSPAALRFTLTGNSVGYIEKTLANAIDFTTYAGVGVGFLALRIPSAGLSSVELRIGSNSTNYYALSQTAGFLGTWTVGNYLLVAFDLSLAATTGTPTVTAIKYVRVTFTHASTLTNIRVGQLFCSLPSPFELLFKSAAIFNVNGALSSQITSDNDQIVLNDSAYTIYEYESAIAAYMNSGGSLASPIVSSITSILNGARARNGQVITLGLYDLYRAANPSEIIQTNGNYYE